MSTAFQRLSSGLRINRAADDAAGLSIASLLDTDARVYSQGIRNLNDGLSAFSIAEGAVSQLSNIVIRIQELAEQSANGTLTFTQRRALNLESRVLVNEYNRIIDTTEFNGLKLLDGSVTSISLQNGYGENGSLVLSIGSAMQNGVGDGSFQAQTQYAAGANPLQVTTADVNGDGIFDLVSTSYGNNSVNVHIGNGDGTFALYNSYSTGSRPFSVASSDLNGDGVLDLVTANHGANNVSVLIGNGDGTFKARTNLGTGANPIFINLADYNNDGNIDIAATDDGSADVVVFLGNGNGTFKASLTNNVPFASRYIASADVNGDGNIDLITTHTGQGQVGVLIGNGNGTFKVEQSYSLGPVSVAGVTVGDFNGDGRSDIGVATSSGISLLYGDGSGVFNTSVSIASGYSAGFLISVDLDENGALDLVSSNFFDATTSVVMNNGDGTFKAPISFATGGASNSVVAEDLNGDGRRDLAVSDENGYIGVLFGNGGASPYLREVDLTTQSAALASLDTMQEARNRLTLELGLQGAAQSRIATAINNLSIIRENNIRAASQIMDVDVAEESSQLTRMNVLQQAGAAVLAQANLQPTIALQLLRNT